MPTATSAHVRRLLLGLALVAPALLLGFAAPAAAHDRLVSSTPAEAAALSEGPGTVVLQFDAAVAEGFSTVAVTGPDGASYSVGAPTTAGSEVRQAVLPGPAGTWTAAYRVVSSDGHPITGSLAFTVAGAPAAPPSSPSASAGPLTQADDVQVDPPVEAVAPRTTGENLLLVLVVAVLAVPFVLLAVAGARRVRQAERR